MYLASARLLALSRAGTPHCSGDIDVALWLISLQGSLLELMGPRDATGDALFPAGTDAEIAAQPLEQYLSRAWCSIYSRRAALAEC